MDKFTEAIPAYRVNYNTHEAFSWFMAFRLSNFLNPLKEALFGSTRRIYDEISDYRG
jgi:hypothetical protein